MVTAMKCSFNKYSASKADIFVVHSEMDLLYNPLENNK